MQTLIPDVTTIVGRQVQELGSSLPSQARGLMWRVNIPTYPRKTFHAFPVLEREGAEQGTPWLVRITRIGNVGLNSYNGDSGE